MFLSLTDLALLRAGVKSLEEFQQREGLYPSGKEDILTMQRLSPFLLGYRRHMIRSGDTYYRIARQYGTTVRALQTANPGFRPGNLPVGQYLTVPCSFPVVPTDRPFTSELLAVCIQGLRARYPFIMQKKIGMTAWGRPVTMIRIGRGSRTVLYNASHHANEWITTPVLMKFLEDYCEALSLRTALFGMDAEKLFLNTRLCLVPMVNPDGVDLVTGAIEKDSAPYLAARKIADYFPAVPFPQGWKANLQGTDLNLNYPAGWENARKIKYQQGYDRPAPRDFVGYRPLDQPETAAMAELTETIHPVLTLSYHTQGQVIYWKYLNTEPAGARKIGEAFAEVSGYELEDTPYASGFAGYKDWFILTENRPGYTIEAGTGTNPLPMEEFDRIYEKNLGILSLGLKY